MIKFPMTLQGAKKLREELNELKMINRPRIIASISEARKYGDLKENAEYHAAREQQAFNESRIKQIEIKLSHAQIIDITKIPFRNRIIFGSTVTILNLDNSNKYIYRIVGDDESDHKKQLISINSPLARGLIGKKISDMVLIKTPSGNCKYQILNIQYI
ncbi:MAG: transcription elongation factor GreA [Candidatus Dasytiphilus stammeri]